MSAEAARIELTPDERRAIRLPFEARITGLIIALSPAAREFYSCHCERFCDFVRAKDALAAAKDALAAAEARYGESERQCVECPEIVKMRLGVGRIIGEEVDCLAAAERSKALVEGGAE
jgi:hypothetical protein